MKKFTIAAAAAMALASAAPAMADQKTSDDPFVSTQGGGALLAGGAATGIAIGTILLATVAIAGSSDSTGSTPGS
ncbi:hypothetical protein M8756_17420 [Lutimaribacter sp. EGI FJ00015]|uniref:Uncharacterized protein n=1 Tax=Lutimaribacter degradans TaxID=2945989 RepID=A0ACC6A137_9RHOB|nr:hypothetical protein [Lutimaribacter sp. EGI FJ00013]MCM2563898.1 hypothetical protein [Lutimaribacter sp. EGI FJ00013]MCO0615096.1 hypothetical protein [Lutimaribacter sp. EGI FJ00015]MCO0637728.1 hypothetical protein [Lutimaribacter sp. EGI FJ00014]